MLRITPPSPPPQSYDWRNFSEHFTFIFPWKGQPVAKQPPYSRDGLKQQPQSHILQHEL